MGHNKEKLDEMGHLHLLLDEMGLDEMGLDEMGINRFFTIRRIAAVSQARRV